MQRNPKINIIKVIIKNIKGIENHFLKWCKKV